VILWTIFRNSDHSDVAELDNPFSSLEGIIKNDYIAFIRETVMLRVGFKLLQSMFNLKLLF
jgi:hypothetical protein